jgi:3-oxoadipate enol-lactonase
MDFTYRGKNIYYETTGQGKPLLLLNGIMMSTLSWAPFVQAFAQVGYQVLSIDLMDQGRSDAFDMAYDMGDQADMVLALADALNMKQFSLLGTSYGGALALQIACQAPERVERLLLSATRCYSDPLFRDMCESWIHASHDPQALYTATMPLFYGATFQQQQTEWLADRRQLLEKTAFQNPDFQARFRRLCRSIMAFDLREQLHRIACPTLIISAEEDLVMMPWEQQRIVKGIPAAQHVTMHKTGHVMFLERPDLFVSLVNGFLQHLTPIEIP